MIQCQHRRASTQARDLLDQRFIEHSKNAWCNIIKGDFGKSGEHGVMFGNITVQKIKKFGGKLYAGRSTA